MRKTLTALFAAVTPRKTAATLALAGSLGGGIAATLPIVTSAAASGGTSLAMSYDGHSNMSFD